MFKGMQKRITLACVLVLLAAPAIYASETGNEARPWITVSSIMSDILGGIEQALDEMWVLAFESSESEPVEIPGSDGGAQSANSEPPPNPPGPENGDGDDGNIGGGQEPWG